MGSVFSLAEIIELKNQNEQLKDWCARLSVENLDLKSEIRELKKKIKFQKEHRH